METGEAASQWRSVRALDDAATLLFEWLAGQHNWAPTTLDAAAPYGALPLGALGELRSQGVLVISARVGDIGESRLTRSSLELIGLPDEIGRVRDALQTHGDDHGASIALARWHTRIRPPGEYETIAHDPENEHFGLPSEALERDAYPIEGPHHWIDVARLGGGLDPARWIEGVKVSTHWDVRARFPGLQLAPGYEGTIRPHEDLIFALRHTWSLTILDLTWGPATRIFDMAAEALT